MKLINTMTCVLTQISIILSLISCVSNDSLDSTVMRDTETLSVMTKAFTEEEVPEETRSTLEFDETNKELLFSWQEGDKLMLFNKSTALDGSENVACAAYSLKTIVNSNSAIFSGGGFDLSNGYDYFAFTPYDGLIKDGSMQDVSSPVQLSYENQKQTANKSTDHLGKFDYQAAMSYVGSDGKLTFDFEHLSAILRIKMKITDTDAKKRAYKALTLYTTDNYDFKMVRAVRLVKNAESPSDYHPAFDDVTSESGASVLHSITLELGENGAGIVPDDNGILCMYIAIPGSSELYNNGSPRTIYADVTPVDDTAPHYNISFLAKDYKGGTCYTIGRPAVESGKATLQVYVERAWQNGSVYIQGDSNAKSADITRSASVGDPGNDAACDLPTNLIIYVSIDGHPMQKQSVTKISASDWKVDGTRLQYRQPINIDLNVVPVSSVRAYVMAYNDEAFYTSKISYGVDIDESVLRNMELEFKPKSEDDVKQSILKNLYSTPYVEGSNNGLSTDMSNLNLIACLYHVACKVDLNWELDDGMKLTNYTVKKLRKTGKFFMPTANESISSGGDSYSFDTVAKNEINGRSSFYAIQQINGNGKFPLSVTWTETSDGSSKNKPIAETINLQPSDDRTTSWFRINRKWDK